MYCPTFNHSSIHGLEFRFFLLWNFFYGINLIQNIYVENFFFSRIFNLKSKQIVWFMIALMELGESFWALWHHKRMQLCCNDVSMKWTIDGIIWNPRVLQSGLYNLHIILVCDIFEVFWNYHAHLDYIIRNSWWTLVFTTWNSDVLMQCASVDKMLTKPYFELLLREYVYSGYWVNNEHIWNFSYIFEVNVKTMTISPSISKSSEQIIGELCCLHFFL